MRTTLIEAIVAANFMADLGQVERLAAAVVEGSSADGTYLRVVLAHMQSRLGKPRRGRRSAADVESVEAVLEAIHTDLYAHVLKGVGPDDLDATERNRRANFARSAAATVRYFIREGGDIRSVDVATATKGGLRAAVQPQQPEAPEGETRVERGFRKAQQAMVRSAQRLLARGDPDAAREMIEQTLEVLEGLLALEAPAKPTTQPVAQPQDFGGTTTTFGGRNRAPGRGTPAGAMLHRPAGG